MRIIGLAIAFTLAGISFAAQAADLPEVRIKAYDSRGVDTGKCLTIGDEQVFFRLTPCDPASRRQIFGFDPNGEGGPLYHTESTLAQRKIFPFGGTWPIDAACLNVLNTQRDPKNAWKVGAAVGKADCNGDAPTTWRWSAKQIIATESPGKNFCLTANSSRGPSIRLGDCSKPETLTAWDVLLAR
jgi:hypothetical protein